MPNLTWRRAAGCASGDCIEVAIDGDAVLVRDSKLGDNSPTIRYAAEFWMRLMADIDDGALPFDITTAGDDFVWRRLSPRSELRFTKAEIVAFMAAAADGEFDLDRLAAGAR
jgi:hypothetical protein